MSNENNDDSNVNNSNESNGDTSESPSQPRIEKETQPLSAARARTRYKQEMLLNEFTKVLHTSATVEQVCEHFKINRTTYYTWSKKAAARDRKFMSRHYEDILMNEITNTVNQFKRIILTMNSIMGNANVTPQDRIDAAKLAGEVQLCLLTVYSEGPSTAWSSMPYGLKEIITGKEPVVPQLIEIPSVKSSDNDNNQEQGS